jgi:hypothetical protein
MFIQFKDTVYEVYEVEDKTSYVTLTLANNTRHDVTKCELKAQKQIGYTDIDTACKKEGNGLSGSPLIVFGRSHVTLKLDGEILETGMIQMPTKKTVISAEPDETLLVKNVYINKQIVGHQGECEVDFSEIEYAVLEVSTQNIPSWTLSSVQGVGAHPDNWIKLNNEPFPYGTYYRYYDDTLNTLHIEWYLVGENQRFKITYVNTSNQQRVFIYDYYDQTSVLLSDILIDRKPMTNIAVTTYYDM